MGYFCFLQAVYSHKEVYKSAYVYMYASYKRSTNKDYQNVVSNEDPVLKVSSVGEIIYFPK